MTGPNSGQSLLMQGGLPSVVGELLKTKGDRFDGIVVEVKPEYQGRDLQTGELDFWDSPNNTQPKYVVPIVVTNDNDHKDWALNVGMSTDLQRKIARATNEAGMQYMMPGSHITVWVAGTEAAPKKGLSDKKIYGCQLTKPANSGQNALMQSSVPTTLPVDTSTPPPPATSATPPAATAPVSAVTPPPAQSAAEALPDGQGPGGIPLPPGFAKWADVSPEMQTVWLDMQNQMRGNA